MGLVGRTAEPWFSSKPRPISSKTARVSARTGRVVGQFEESALT